MTAQIPDSCVLERRDGSKSMAELRSRMTQQPLPPDRDASSQEVQEWIASTFKRSYRF